MALHVKLDPAMLRKLRQVERPVLAQLAPVTQGHASSVLFASLFLVPVQDAEHHDPAQPHLAETSFIDGPEINTERASVTSTCGYEHPDAGAIHENFHWGMDMGAPPNFLRDPAKRGRSPFRREVATTLMSALAAVFPQS